MSSTSSTADELIAAIEANPDDPAAYAVYGDWLLEHGDPLGEMVALYNYCEAELDPVRHRELDERWRHLVAAYHEAHIAPLEWWPSWRFGFVDRLELSTNLGHEAIEALTSASALRFLRQLYLDIQPIPPRSAAWEDPTDTTDPTPALRARALPKTLRFLSVEIHLYEGGERPFDLGVLYPQIQSVEELELDSPGALGVIDLPNLTHLRLRGYRPEAMTELSRAVLPKLQKLSLEQGPWEALGELDLRAPRLEELFLERHSWVSWMHATPERLAEHHRAAFAAMASSPVVRSVETLDLTSGVNRDTVEALIACAPSLLHLERLKILRNSIDPPAQEALARILGPRLVTV